MFPLYQHCKELLADERAISLFESMREQYAKHKSFDAMSLVCGKEMTECGMYIAEAMVCIPGSAMISRYYEDLLDKYKQKTLLEAYRLSNLYVEEGRADEAKRIIDEAQQKIDAYMSTTPEDDLSQWFSRLCSAYDNRNKPKIYLGFPTLDKYIGSMMPGQMHILGARPKVGKSLVATNIALNVAKKGFGVLYFSLEMSSDQMLSRAVAAFSKGGVTTSQHLTEEHISTVSNVISEFAKLPLWFACGVFSVTEMERTISQYIAQGRKIDFVVVDYLQLIKGDQRKSRYEQVTEISTGIKRMAMSLEVPVLALSQLSRDSADGEPKVHHLRESGSIEQDAESIMLLWRPSEEDSTIQLLLRGNRNGESFANIYLDFDYKSLSVKEISAPPLTPQNNKKTRGY